jgi:hypothetical protein
VLKDIWIDHESNTREGTELHAEASSEDKKFVQKHFLATISYGDAWTEPGVLDDTENRKKIVSCAG